MLIYRYTVKEFLELFRPNGIGEMAFVSEDEVEVIPFKEIICDYCNDLIWDGESEEDKSKELYVTEYSEAICEKCASKYKV